MKRIPAAAAVAIALWLVTFFAPSGHAQTSQAGTAPQALDDDALSAMLTGLGYEPKKLTHGFLISAKKDDWTYYLQFVLSPDKTRLGMNANMGAVADPDAVTAAQWRGLLEQNIEIDPSSFNYDKTQKKLYLHRVLENRALTPSYVRTQIDNFCKNIHDTSDYWNFAK